MIIIRKEWRGRYDCLVEARNVSQKGLEDGTLNLG